MNDTYQSTVRRISHLYLSPIACAACDDQVHEVGGIAKGFAKGHPLAICKPCADKIIGNAEREAELQALVKVRQVALAIKPIVHATGVDINRALYALVQAKEGPLQRLGQSVATELGVVGSLGEALGMRGADAHG
jgi:hypothetical protein